MKKVLYLALIIFSAFSFTACVEDDDEWRDKNEKFYEKLAEDPEYSIVSLPGVADAVYYKVLEKGEGTEYPLQTSQVKVLYRGFYYTGTEFDSGHQDINYPATLNVNGVVRGLSIALQNMKVGDKWEVWVPWPLGYGSTSYNSISAYTTLGFEVEILEIIMYP
ncbi:FKBP-type peptidyl-prolyl cis-trans isomerase [Bacteroidales bacterium OttesenSCG-928-M11]|nr:FKBP-type peptidyl-prolyl cis-trans isomerase [Bacteroidales bacterium OttesenSCG-928-M11]